MRSTLIIETLATESFTGRGANWIHGTIDNPIYDIAKQCATTLHVLNEEQAIIDPNGHQIDSDEAAEHINLIWDGLVEDAYKFSNENKDSIDPHRSLYDYFVERSTNLFTDLPPAIAERKRRTLLLITDMWGAYVGSPVTRQSLRSFWMEECLRGETLFVAGTFSEILQEVAAHAMKRANVRLNCEVTAITTAVDADHDNGRQCIDSSDGSRSHFDAVVVTTPLGWLKHNHQGVFRPALPSRLAQAIENVDWGELDKVYITFPSAFWEDQGLGDNNSLRNGAASDLSHSRRACPGGSMYLAPTYTPNTNPERWYQECVNLSVLPTECAQPTLLFYTHGECSKYLAGLVSGAKTTSEGDAKVLEFFRPYYALLPNYDPANPACIPKGVLATAWAADKWAGYGSYSNFLTGVVHADKDIEAMRLGLPERGVYLAGEHTAPFLALGTTTGAYLSGQKVAERILRDCSVA